MYTDSFIFCPQNWKIQNWEVQSDSLVFSSASVFEGRRESNCGMKEETKSTVLSFSGEMSETLKLLESKVRRRIIPATLKYRKWMLFRLKIRMNEKHPKHLSRVFFLCNEQLLQVKAKAANTKGSEIMRADDQSTLRLDTRSLSKAEVEFDDCTKIHNHQFCRNVWVEHVVCYIICKYAQRYDLDPCLFTKCAN